METTLNALLLLTHDVTGQSMQARPPERSRCISPIRSFLHEIRQAPGVPACGLNDKALGPVSGRLKAHQPTRAARPTAVSMPSGAIRSARSVSSVMCALAS